MSVVGGSSPQTLPLLPSNAAAMRRTSQGASSTASATAHGAQPSGVGLAVLRSQQRMEMLKDIASGTAALRVENGHMEDILSEEHRMMTNADVSAILSNMFVGRHASSILSSRKPPVRLPFRQYKNGGSSEVRALMEDTYSPVSTSRTQASAIAESTSNSIVIPTDDVLSNSIASRRSHVASIRGLTSHRPTKDTRHEGGKVNYRVLLEQQSEEIQQIDRNSVAYREMVRAVVHSQQRIGEGL